MSNKQIPPPDPLFRSSLHELKWIIAIWAGTFVWVIGYCRLFGYGDDEAIDLTMGMPSWAFWGVFLPWGIASLASCWFALAQMQDHPLETDDSDDGGELSDG
jgi:hypothetical protein